MQSAEELEALPAGERGPKLWLTGHIGELPVHPDGIPPRVRTEQRGSSRRGPLKAEQQPDRRRLPGTVWTRNPYTSPAGMERSSESSATVDPYRFVRPRALIAAVVELEVAIDWIMTSRSGFGQVHGSLAARPPGRRPG